MIGSDSGIWLAIFGTRILAFPVRFETVRHLPQRRAPFSGAAKGYGGARSRRSAFYRGRGEIRRGLDLPKHLPNPMAALNLKSRPLRYAILGVLVQQLIDRIIALQSFQFDFET